jgi:hypothetical protein
MHEGIFLRLPMDLRRRIQWSILIERATLARALVRKAESCMHSACPPSVGNINECAALWEAVGALHRPFELGTETVCVHGTRWVGRRVALHHDVWYQTLDDPYGTLHPSEQLRRAFRDHLLPTLWEVRAQCVPLKQPPEQDVRAHDRSVAEVHQATELV